MGDIALDLGAVKEDEEGSGVVTLIKLAELESDYVTTEELRKFAGR